MKIAESLEAVYIYIYIVSFKKIELCKYGKEAMYFRTSKMYGFFIFSLICEKY